MKRTRGLWASIIFVCVLVVASLVGFATGALKPTLGLDTLIASICAQTFRLDSDRTARTLFPSAGREQAMERLLRI